MYNIEIDREIICKCCRENSCCFWFS